MRLHFASDLHHDVPGNRLTERPNVEAHAIVLAGDGMAPGSHALRLARWLYPDTSIPLIYVPGNHDYYSETNPKLLAVDPTLKTTWERERQRMREISANLGITLLDDDLAVIEVDDEQVRFVGGTLWSSFAARGPHVMFGEAVMEAKRRMHDYAFIKTGRGRGRDKLRPGDTVDAHKRSVAFLEETLSTEFDGATVVVTHHAPSYRSLADWDPKQPRRFGDMDWCYASDLEHLMTGNGAPELWVHGHVHRNVDYEIGDGVRVVCNPRGYPSAKHASGRENPDFDPTLVIEVEPRPKMAWGP